MAWIELHQSLVRHPKVLRVASRLRVSEEAVIGHMATLWCWALDAKPQGGPLTDLDVRAGANWKARSDIVSALIDARFLDEQDDGLWLHDWPEYAGRLIRQREMAKERARKARAANPHGDGTLPESYAHGARSVREQFAPTVPNRTEPDPLSVPPTPHRTGLTEEQELIRIKLHGMARDQLLGGASAPDLEWCEDLIRRGLADSDVDVGVQAALGKGRGALAYCRAVMLRRVEEREAGVDHDQLARDRAAAALREPHGGSSRPRGVARNGDGAGSLDEFGDLPPGAIRADHGGATEGDPGARAPISLADRARTGGIPR